MLRMSVPSSWRWVAKLWRSVWGVMRRLDAGLAGGSGNDLLGASGAQVGAGALAGEEIARGFVGGAEAADLGEQGGRERRDAVLAALAGPHPEDGPVSDQVAGFQSHRLAHAQARRVDQHDQRAVLGWPGGGEQARDLSAPGHLGELLRSLGPRYLRGQLRAAENVACQEAHSAERDRVRAARHAAVHLGQQEGADVLRGERLGRDARVPQEVTDVRAVRLPRSAAQAPELELGLQPIHRPGAARRERR
jgi:hypothetical protein